MSFQVQHFMSYLTKSISDLFSSHETNNYKLFFPMALPGFLCGIGIWSIDRDYTFSRTWHPFLVTHSMLFPIILGFLWTGIPRFIATEFPSNRLKTLYFILLTASLAAFAAQSLLLYKLIMFISYVGLFFWFFRAYSLRKVTPPIVISFLFFALTAGTIGTGIIFISEITSLPTIVQLTGKNLHRYVFFVMLITSVGSRMIPVMELKSPPGKKSLSVWALPISKNNYFWWIISGLIFLFLAIPPEVNINMVSFMRILILLFIVKEIWHFFQPGGNKIMITKFLYIVQILFLISPGIVFFKNVFFTSASHFFSLSILFLFVLMVSARVILAHGGHGLSREKHSYLFFIAYCSIIAGIFLRTFADYLIEYMPVFRITSIVLILSVGVWIIEILRAIFFDSESGSQTDIMLKKSLR